MGGRKEAQVSEKNRGVSGTGGQGAESQGVVGDQWGKELTKAQVDVFQDYAVRAFHAIDGTGMARCDFFLERRSGKIYVNELNTIPGFTSISMYPKLWEASGLPYPKLIDRLIELAIELHAEKARTKYSIELPAGSGGALDA